MASTKTCDCCGVSVHPLMTTNWRRFTETAGGVTETAGATAPEGLDALLNEPHEIDVCEPCYEAIAQAIRPVMAARRGQVALQQAVAHLQNPTGEPPKAPGPSTFKSGGIFEGAIGSDVDIAAIEKEADEMSGHGSDNGKHVVIDPSYDRIFGG